MRECRNRMRTTRRQRTEWVTHVDADTMNLYMRARLVWKAIAFHPLAATIAVPYLLPGFRVTAVTRTRDHVRVDTEPTDVEGT